ncbi:uncharacterized protein LOC134943950 isoform X1 [Pseudophryne corroboree]|uniref:uncharacterized protein LOC134943950 isoform X1 n=1 Tax=Pseudophryne corroboree TaxID=495146 RepID=UPI0030815BBB
MTLPVLLLVTAQEKHSAGGSGLLIALGWAPDATMVSPAFLLILILVIKTSRGSPDLLVWQSNVVTVERKRSVKLNCTVSKTLHLQKPALTWIKRYRNGVEVQVYPADKYWDQDRFQVDGEGFQNLLDAGILMTDLRRQDSGLYLCCITPLQGSMTKECGGGTYLTIQVTAQEKHSAGGSGLLIALGWAPDASMVSPAFLLILILVIKTSRGSPDLLVWQSNVVTVERKRSVKLNCTVSKTLHLQKPALTWIKRYRNGEEVQVYPADKYWDQDRFQVDGEGFQNLLDAGILMTDLRRQDSGLYLCCITPLQGSMTKECGGGTYLTIQATNYDRLIACCPLGVFIAALLVLHGLVYKQWVEYRKLESENAEEMTYRIWISRFFSGFTDLLSAL